MDGFGKTTFSREGFRIVFREYLVRRTIFAGRFPQAHS